VLPPGVDPVSARIRCEDVSVLVYCWFIGGEGQQGVRSSLYFVVAGFAGSGVLVACLLFSWLEGLLPGKGGWWWWAPLGAGGSLLRFAFDGVRRGLVFVFRVVWAACLCQSRNYAFASHTVYVFTFVSFVVSFDLCVVLISFPLHFFLSLCEFGTSPSHSAGSLVLLLLLSFSRVFTYYRLIWCLCCCFSPFLWFGLVFSVCLFLCCFL
jgi:hypothetical protein